MLQHSHVIKVGKAVRHISRLRGGSGSALPGLIVEKIDPSFASRVLSQLPEGVIIISGTNGKTTTTKMVCSLLRDSGLKVFTNKSGSNFTRGIIASMLASIDSRGNLNADIAVLELDEAYAARFVTRVAPKYSLILNVMRDQLDRFGEIDHTARLLKTVAEATTDGVVLNRDDSLVSSISGSLKTNIHVRYFGLSDHLLSSFPNDSSLYGDKLRTHKLPVLRTSDVLLQNFSGQAATFSYGKKSLPKTILKLQGLYNLQNAAAALCLTRMILKDKQPSESLLDSLSQIKPAFGRGEAIMIEGKPLEIILVKNPAGFRLAIESYNHDSIETMIAINDNYADGRDMSWLWDVDFTKFNKIDYVSGMRAYDMALRLQYDDVAVGKVNADLKQALQDFIRGTAKPRRIFCTYTAMMTIRKLLSKQFSLEAIDE